jgi:hypothetical protein
MNLPDAWQLVLQIGGGFDAWNGKSVRSLCREKQESATLLETGASVSADRVICGGAM